MDYQKIASETDRKIVRYDIAQHNWPEYWLRIARDKYPEIESLETAPIIRCKVCANPIFLI